MSISAEVKTSVKNISSAQIIFELIATHVDDFEEMSYTTYGIRAVCPKGGTEVCYPDISTSKEFVQEFLDMVNGHDVSAVHIHDLIEDFLS